MNKGSSVKKKASSVSNVAAPHAHAPLVEEQSGLFTRKNVGRLLKPIATQVSGAPGFVRELRGSKSYARDFGADAPAAADVADAVEIAAAWAAEAKNADAWAKFAQQQKEIAWNGALGLTNKLKTEWEHAVGNHPEIAASYPESGTFFGARKGVAARGLATRRANKKKKSATTP
ncbi:MAG TPA: hypothetical protein VGH28_30395 [Polyangiaceae bacterium]|jgi:hypothetical protein